MKRTSEKQLTQLTAEKEEDAPSEPAGTWESATPDVLAQRRIVKAHRPGPSPNPAEPSAPNPFAAAAAAFGKASSAAAGAPAAAGCTWSLSAQQPFSFSLPPMQTSKSPPAPAPSAGGFCTGSAAAGGGGGSSCVWSTAGGGGGFGGLASQNAASSFAALASAAGAPAVDGAGKKISSFPPWKSAAGSPAADGEDAGGDDGGDDGAAAEEVPIVAAPKLPLVETVTGEEDEQVIHKVRAKLFVLEPLAAEAEKRPAGGDADDNSAAAPATEAAPGAAATSTPAKSPAGGAGEACDSASRGAAPARWAERGVGQVHLNVPKVGANAAAAEFKPGAGAHKAAAPPSRPPRLVMRVEHVGRLVLNAPLLAELPPPQRASDTSVRISSIGHPGGVPVESVAPSSFQVLLRMKTSAEAEQLFNALNKALQRK